MMKTNRRQTSIITVLLMLLGGFVPLTPAHAATKYALTCKVGGFTTVAKPISGYTKIEFEWFRADGTLIGKRETALSTDNFFATPPEAKSVIAYIFFDTTLGESYRTANSHCR